MLLQAVPKDIYEDIVANRHMSAGQVMFKLHTIFSTGRSSGENFSATNVGGLEKPIQ